MTVEKNQIAATVAATLAAAVIQAKSQKGPVTAHMAVTIFNDVIEELAEHSNPSMGRLRDIVDRMSE
jgi:hypothetical protein